MLAPSYFNFNKMLVPNSEVDVTVLEEAKNSGKGIIDSYLGLDKLDQGGSYFNNADNEKFFLNLFGLKAPERSAAKAMIKAVKKMNADIENGGKFDNFALEEMNCGDLYENQARLVERFKDMDRVVLYASHVIYQLSDQELKSLLLFASDTGYELVVQGASLHSRLYSGEGDFTPTKDKILLTKIKVSYQNDQHVFKIEETPLYDISDDCARSYKESKEEAKSFDWAL